MRESFEVVIIGAGLTGIIAAQRYLDAHPAANITLLEKDPSVGGVFNRRRLYPGFYTQWPVGLFSFSDLPFEQPPEEDRLGFFFKAKYAMEYFERYVEGKGHNGRTLYDRIRFNVDVRSIVKKEGQWIITYVRDWETSKKETTITAKRVMVASGQHSRPNIPAFSGRETFNGPIIHSSQFGESQVLSLPNMDRLVIVGAGKSSADMLYESVKAGKQVSWVIRKSGAGPGWFAPTDVSTPYQNVQEAAQTQFMAKLHPSLLHKDGWWVWFLHQTWIGIAIVTWMFGMVDKEAKKRANYRGRPNGRGFELLEYETGIFWQDAPGGALHHSDFWDLVEKYVTVYRQDIEGLRSRHMVLADGTDIHCDAVLLGTGWKPGLEFFNDETLTSLGLPHDPKLESAQSRRRWDQLILEGDEFVLKRFPTLANPPSRPYKSIADSTPYRLYNGMVPIHDQSILFLNHLTSANLIFSAGAQAMWAVAFFDGNIKLPKTADMEKEIGTWIAYCKRRYLSSGQLADFAMFDTVPYVDRLMLEMGLKSYWKGWGRDAWEVKRMEDLGRAWEEYLSRRH